jgi:hypothetical protein
MVEAIMVAVIMAAVIMAAVIMVAVIMVEATAAAVIMVEAITAETITVAIIMMDTMAVTGMAMGAWGGHSHGRYVRRPLVERLCRRPVLAMDSGRLCLGATRKRQDMAHSFASPAIDSKPPRILLNRAETLAALRIGETTLHWLARTKKLKCHQDWCPSSV